MLFGLTKNAPIVFKLLIRGTPNSPIAVRMEITVSPPTQPIPQTSNVTVRQDVDIALKLLIGRTPNFPLPARFKNRFYNLVNTTKKNLIGWPEIPIGSLYSKSAISVDAFPVSKEVNGRVEKRVNTPLRINVTLPYVPAPITRHLSVYLCQFVRARVS